MFEADPSGVLWKFRGFVDIDMLQSSILPEFNGPVNQDEPAFSREHMEVRLEKMEVVEEGAVFYYTCIFFIREEIVRSKIYCAADRFLLQ